MKIPRNLYFIGAGGIGMANLERYYLSKGCRVAGYDRTESRLTEALADEGAEIAYDDDPALIPAEMLSDKETLVVYTPAVGDDNRILTRFREAGFQPIKRAALLGQITRHTDAICVAGSHGKTTTSSMIAWILAQTEKGCNAFLGGILRNTGSNLMLSEKSNVSVIEADEYDRSFHHLTPWMAIVTSTDPDHLDIYGDEEGYLEGFAHFTSLIRPGGILIVHEGLKLKPRTGEDVKVVTYSGKDLHDSDDIFADRRFTFNRIADWQAGNIRYKDGKLLFDLSGPNMGVSGIELGVPVRINVDNAVAAAAACFYAGATWKEIREGLRTFKGPERRFQIWLDGTQPGGKILIDDYGHSPNEVKASIESVKKLYPGKKVSVVFQPHLYSRTKDFAPEFASALSKADEVIMTEIYPAREKPIPGVDSQMVLKDVKSKEKTFCERKDLLNLIKIRNFEVLMTLGAADLNVLLPEISGILTS